MSHILYSLSQISSLFLIDHLQAYIQFINQASSHLTTELSSSLSSLISRIFIIYTEMRAISQAFDMILQSSSLVSVYTTASIESCLCQQASMVLPLQLSDILNNLKQYLLHPELILFFFLLFYRQEEIVKITIFFMKCFFHSMLINESNVQAIFAFIASLRQVKYDLLFLFLVYWFFIDFTYSIQF